MGKDLTARCDLSLLNVAHKHSKKFASSKLLLLISSILINLWVLPTSNEINYMIVLELYAIVFHIYYSVLYYNRRDVMRIIYIHLLALVRLLHDDLHEWQVGWLTTENKRIFSHNTDYTKINPSWLSSSLAFVVSIMMRSKLITQPLYYRTYIVYKTTSACLLESWVR